MKEIDDLKGRLAEQYSATLIAKKDKEIQSLKEKCEKLEEENHKFLVQNILHKSADYQKVLLRTDNKPNNTTSNFPVKSEVKNLWQKFGKDELLNNFLDFEDDPALVHHLVSELFILSCSMISSLCENKIAEISKIMNVKYTKQIFTELKVKFNTFMKEHLDDIFRETEEENYISQFKASYLQAVNKFVRDEQRSQTLTQTVNSFDFLEMLKVVNNLVLITQFNEPPLFFKIDDDISRPRNVVNIVVDNNREDYLIPNCTADKKFDAVLIVNPPVLENGLQFFKEIKPIIMPVKSDSNDIDIDIEEIKSTDNLKKLCLYNRYELDGEKGKTIQSDKTKSVTADTKSTIVLKENLKENLKGNNTMTLGKKNIINITNYYNHIFNKKSGTENNTKRAKKTKPKINEGKESYKINLNIRKNLSHFSKYMNSSKLSKTIKLNNKNRVKAKTKQNLSYENSKGMCSNNLKLTINRPTFNCKIRPQTTKLSTNLNNQKSERSNNDDFIIEYNNYDEDKIKKTNYTSRIINADSKPYKIIPNKINQERAKSKEYFLTDNYKTAHNTISIKYRQIKRINTNNNRQLKIDYLKCNNNKEYVKTESKFNVRANSNHTKSSANKKKDNSFKVKSTEDSNNKLNKLIKNSIINNDTALKCFKKSTTLRAFNRLFIDKNVKQKLCKSKDTNDRLIKHTRKISQMSQNKIFINNKYFCEISPYHENYDTNNKTSIKNNLFTEGNFRTNSKSKQNNNCKINNLNINYINIQDRCDSRSTRTKHKSKDHNDNVDNNKPSFIYVPIEELKRLIDERIYKQKIAGKQNPLYKLNKKQKLLYNQDSKEMKCNNVSNKNTNLLSNMRTPNYNAVNLLALSSYELFNNENMNNNIFRKIDLHQKKRAQKSIDTIDNETNRNKYERKGDEPYKVKL